MKNKKVWIAITIIVLIFGGCFGDRVVSEVVFAYQCENNIGVFVFETVELGDDYIVPISDDVSKRNASFDVDDSLTLDKERIRQNYDIEFYKKEEVSDFGPVQSLTTSIVRKSDKKIMGKVVSFRNYMGWASNIGANVKTRKNCPVSDNKRSKSFNGKFHSQIINKIFIFNRS